MRVQSTVVRHTYQLTHGRICSTRGSACPLTSPTRAVSVGVGDGEVRPACGRLISEDAATVSNPPSPSTSTRSTSRPRSGDAAGLTNVMGRACQAPSLPTLVSTRPFPGSQPGDHRSGAALCKPRLHKATSPPAAKVSVHTTPHHSLAVDLFARGSAVGAPDPDLCCLIRSRNGATPRLAES